MPVLDGYEATKQIRTYCSQMKLQQPKIIACTGHTEQEFTEKAWNMGIDEVIQKPLSVEIAL